MNAPASRKILSAGMLEATKAAEDLGSRAGRRGFLIVRRSFVQLFDDDTREAAPLKTIVSRKGGGGVPLKLYLGLLWLCSSEPFTSEIRAARWATLLGLPDPQGQGKRRVAEGLTLLARLNLVVKHERPGGVSVIELLDESGDLSAKGAVRRYTRPYDAHQAAKSTKRRRASRYRNWYFKIPAKLWIERADIQQMSTPALTMLLAYLSEAKPDQPDVWWSPSAFEDRYRLSPAMKTRGISELVERGLLYVNKAPVGTPGKRRSFAPERVRNIYKPTRRLSGYMKDEN